METQYLELAERIGHGNSERIPQLFKMVAEPDEAEILLALPGNAKSLAEKLGRSEEEINRSFETLFHKGLVFPYYKTDPPGYRMVREVVQFHDATILWPEAPRAFLDLWYEWSVTEWPEFARSMLQVLPQGIMRVIPVGVTVEADSHVLAFEDVRATIEKARNLAVTPCTCRRSAQKCDHTLEACLQIDRAADYALARGTGRQLTKEEALDLIRRTEEEGLVHCTVNRKSIDQVICNCCPCCCQMLDVVIKYGSNVVEPSRFQARVDPELCSGCEICLDRCYFGAVEMVEPNGGGDLTARIIAEKCQGCGLCRVTCPEEAITLVEIRSQDYVPEKMAL